MGGLYPLDLRQGDFCGGPLMQTDRSDGPRFDLSCSIDPTRYSEGPFLPFQGPIPWRRTIEAGLKGPAEKVSARSPREPPGWAGLGRRGSRSRGSRWTRPGKELKGRRGRGRTGRRRFDPPRTPGSGLMGSSPSLRVVAGGNSKAPRRWHGAQESAHGKGMPTHRHFRIDFDLACWRRFRRGGGRGTI